MLDVESVFFHSFFFVNYTAPTEIYTYWHTLSLHDALPIYSPLAAADWYISGLDDLVMLRERMPQLRGHVLDRRHVFEIDRHEASRKQVLISQDPHIARRKQLGLAWEWHFHILVCF